MRTLVLALSCIAACGGGGSNGGDPETPFGLEARVAVTTLTFPTGLPSPGAIRIVRAFQNLAFTRPLALASPADGTNRVFVAEQAGRIYVFANDDAVAARTLFLDITGAVSNSGNEEGLLGLAFPADYDQTGWFYVYYSISGPRRSRLSRFLVSADPDVADPTSEEILLEFPQPYSNHNGGCLQFGPDQKLYVAAGDGGSSNDPQNNAQNLGNLLGKILRLNPDGSIPSDNPFVGQVGARGEIWAYGLRNPWRFSFDRVSATLWCGDVGQNQIEEIDIIERGKNYGWRVYEGNRSNVNPDNLPPQTFEPPVHTYAHPDGFSITGGYVYRGTSAPTLDGAYIYGDYVTSRVWALVYDGQQVISNEQLGSITNVSSFGEDDAGELYACSFSGGIFRFEQDGGGDDEFPATLSATGLFSDTANLTPAPGVIEYEVNAPLWSDHAHKRRWMALPGSADIGFDATGAWVFPVGSVFVKHFELDLAPGPPPVTTRLETRILIRHETGWAGYVYRWNVAQTDANLLSDSQTQVYTVTDPQAPGGQRDQTWTFPSGADCMTCHTSSFGRVLGVRTRQINRDFDYEGITDNQLRSWNHIGLFTANIGDADRYQRLANVADTGATLANRARSYLAVNCAMCHNDNGATPVNIDLRFGIPTDSMNTHNVAAISGGLRLVPNSKENSVLWQRMGLLDVMRMPPLGSNVVDPVGRDVIGTWIDAGG